MLRLLLLTVLVLLMALTAVVLVRWARSARVDWTGVVAAAGFVAMAFWLRHVTGLG